MPPGLTLREQIYRDIMAALATITTANGYATDIGTLTRGMLAPMETSVLPTASLLPVQDVPEYGAQTLRRQLTCTVRVWVDVAVNDTAPTLEALVGDVQQALEVDTSRGGLADVTLEGPVQYLYLQATETLSGADIAWEVHYKTALTTPRVGV